MIRFITKVLMISIFFVGLGAVGESIWKSLNPNQLDRKQIQIVQIKNDSIERVQVQTMILTSDLIE